MKPFTKTAAGPRGFTLIELLTVIAIIAVLATLLSATLGTAKRKARKAASMGNLRQIALGYNLYLDDHRKRPSLFRGLIDEKYITPPVLFCPEDRRTNESGWASLFERMQYAAPGFASESRGPSIEEAPHSYFKSFHYPDDLWRPIERSALGGLAACQLHGVGRQEPGGPATLESFQGLILRALKDGSVISRQVFWNRASEPPATSLTPGASGPDKSVSQASELPFFLDPVE